MRLNEAGASGSKLRPAIVLAVLPGEFQTLLLCGVSTLDRGAIDAWDEPLLPGSEDFIAAGLHRASYVRLSFLNAITEGEVIGRIGSVSEDFTRQLRNRLADRLRT